MTKLEQFMSLLTGSYDNSKQYEQMQKEQKEFPFARHINHVCNGKILHLPEHFQGIFMVEESIIPPAATPMALTTCFFLRKKKMGFF